MIGKCELPNEFAVVPAVAFKKENVSIPEFPNVTVTIKSNLNKAIAQERCWLDHAMMILEKEEVEEKDVIACHASQENPSEGILPVFTQLLPLFYEKAATVAIIKHGMDMLKKATFSESKNKFL